ncbi:hypothetical protein FRC01_008572, partial [Tulasnella sp. 417]
GLSRGGQPHQQHGMYLSTLPPNAQHPLEPLGSTTHSSAQIVEVPNTPPDQGSFQPHQIQPRQWASFPHPQPLHLSNQGRAPPDTLGGLYPVGSRSQQQQQSSSSLSKAQPVGRPSTSASLPQSYQDFLGPSARVGLRPPSFPTPYQSTIQQSQKAHSYSNGSGALASARAAQSSSSDRMRPSSSATAIQGRRTSSAAIPNVVKAAAAAQTTASHSQAGPPPISAPGTSTSGFHSARQSNMPLKMHVDVRSKPMPASVITPIPASNQAPNAAASTSTIPGSHAEVLQKGPILRQVEKGSPDSILPPSMASISPAPHPNRALSGSQAPPPTTLPLGNSSTAANLPAANEGSTLPSSGETIEPPNLAPPVLTPVRAARDTPVYTYSLPFGPPDSGPTFYQVSQAQLDNQFHLAWEQILKKAGNLHADLQKAILQHLQAVYKHICQTGVRQDDKYHFFIQSGMPRPPVPSTIATANQTPTTAQPPPAAVSAGGPTLQPPPGQIATMHPSTASDAAVSTTGGPARDGPSPDQRPRMEPRPNQTAQQIIDLITASEYTPVDAQIASIPPSSATRNLSPPGPSSTSQRAPPVESLSAPPEAGPSAPNRATSFVETLRQNNPSAQDLADSIIRELGSPRKNARKRKFAPESDVETGQSLQAKGRRKPRLSGGQAQAIEHPSAGPQQDNSDPMGDNPVPMASAPGSRPSPLVPTPAPVRQALPFNPYLPTVPTPLAPTPLRDLAVPIKVPGSGPTKPSADSASSLHQITANLNAPTNVPASESLGSNLPPRGTSQNAASLNSSQEAGQQLPQPNQLEPRPPVQPTVPAHQSLPSLQSSATNTPNIIPPTPSRPPTPAKPPNFTHLIPPPVYSSLPSPRRTHVTTPPPAIAVLPASDDRHLSPSVEPASRGGESEVDELMDDADENLTVGEAVAPVSARTPSANALPAVNDNSAKATETTEMSSLVRVRPRTEFWVEIPYRPDLLKKARKALPSGPKPKARSGISRSRTTSRSASLSADGRVSRTPSQAGSQPNGRS